MTNSRAKLQKTLNHQEPGGLVVDFGASPVTGIHVRLVEQLREHFGLGKGPVKVIEPFQMLGAVEDDLQEAMGVDVIGVSPPSDMFGNALTDWKEYLTPWGQVVLVPGSFTVSVDHKGDTLLYPQGDKTVAPSAKMPWAAYFFDAVNRQEPLEESKLDPEDNVEEFALMGASDLDYWRRMIPEAAQKGKGLLANFGGTGIGDIALVPGLNLKAPKGIRDVADWYMSTLMRPEYLHYVFEKQTDIALKNLAMLKDLAGDQVDVAYICGTDFGTQDSSFCSVETYEELYAPYYRKMNDWIHKNTPWKTFKHSCGAVEPFMESFIASGFDIINPVQINAAGMDPALLKEKYGDRLVFWGGGVDTQKVLPFGTPDEVKAHVHRQCEILAPGGGFVFNTVHNMQANVPLQNVVAMLEAVRQFA
ncbi:MAG: uroporphyrinogen decarboxylase family protein [Bacteroidales bacterium]|nr:uroporphyrinogen decarboxylase family protein [Bacteroidales bacterium]